jgi:alpha-tubulin suppressor-like RCC1 family protein
VATALAAGYDHTCALTSTGGVKCWGANGAGQLGNGSTTASLSPVDVVGLASGVKAISAGLEISCALMGGGGVKCWGSNRFGQLGSDVMTYSPTPRDIPGLTAGVAAIAVGGVHTCALKSEGGVACLGGNAKGQLGNGTNADSSVPVDVLGLSSGVAAITAGGDFTCALAIAGVAKCWGWNYIMELGDGTKTDRSVPVDVLGLPSDLTVIAAGGQHTCALTPARGVMCWGNNISGQLGNGTPTDGSAPVDAWGLTSGTSAIAAGGYHTCAITDSGGVRCWGFNRFGELGNGSTTQSSIPVDVTGLTSGIVAVAAGDYHTCAITSRGGVRCWGWNGLGQPGIGAQNLSSVPIEVNLAIHPTIALRPSKGAGTIARGTTITFSATVRPLGPPGTHATVRFVVYRRDEGGVWRAAATRDVVADSSGRAVLRWGFVTAGSRYIRAKVLPDATYAGSGWSLSVRYAVR